MIQPITDARLRELRRRFESFGALTLGELYEVLDGTAGCHARIRELGRELDFLSLEIVRLNGQGAQADRATQAILDKSDVHVPDPRTVKQLRDETRPTDEQLNRTIP